jgi:hypothetical protein
MDLMSTAQLLGNFGEFVGAIAVVLTLVYLAFQIRQNTLALKTQSLRTTKSQLISINSLVVASNEFTDIQLRGNEDPDQLTRTEWVRYWCNLLNYFHVFEALFLEMQTGVTDQSFWLSEEKSLIALLSTPGAQKVWQTNMLAYTDDFRAYVDSLLEQASEHTAYMDALNRT